ncbi:hypothetical protein ASG82_03685 [Mycobacterium sp. Soil538]|nr:hypothetical protein ASG82_03685 [Mycobacterium sp. Soil538]
MGSSATSSPAPVVIRISPMAHLAVVLLTLALLSVVFAGPVWFVALLVIPVLLSVAIARYRTVADRDTVTARTLLGSQTLRWEDIAGLRFGRKAWAQARRGDGTEVSLPAVTFATLPVLTAASGGRVPNPYE